MTPIELDPSDVQGDDWIILVMTAGAFGAMACYEHKDLIARGVTTNLESVAKWLFRISLVFLALPIVAHLWGGWFDKTTGYKLSTIWACVRLAQGLYLSGVAFGTKHREYHSNPPEQADMTSSKKNRMALVAWAPNGYSAPIELIAARLPPGKVTEREWWEALSNRVSELAQQAGEEVTEAACRALGVPMPDRLYQAGQSLVLHNLNLKTNLNLAVQEDDPFPATVGEPNQEAEDALQLTLMEWVGHALSMVSESSLD